MADPTLIGCEESHGNPFRYCSCGWMEAEKEVKLSLEEKVDYMFNQFLKLEELHNQVTPMLANIEKSPIGKLLGIKK